MQTVLIQMTLLMMPPLDLCFCKVLPLKCEIIGKILFVGYFGFSGPLRQFFSLYRWGGRVVRWCWVNFQTGASYNLDTIGQGPTALAVGTGCLDIFTLVYSFSPLSPSL